jgi:hypothetical protein
MKIPLKVLQNPIEIPLRSMKKIARCRMGPPSDGDVCGIIKPNKIIGISWYVYYKP